MHFRGQPLLFMLELEQLVLVGVEGIFQLIRLLFALFNDLVALPNRGFVFPDAFFQLANSSLAHIKLLLVGFGRMLCSFGLGKFVLKVSKMSIIVTNFRNAKPGF